MIHDGYDSIENLWLLDDESIKETLLRPAIKKRLLLFVAYRDFHFTPDTEDYEFLAITVEELRQFSIQQKKERQEYTQQIRQKRLSAASPVPSVTTRDPNDRENERRRRESEAQIRMNKTIHWRN